MIPLIFDALSVCFACCGRVMHYMVSGHTSEKVWGEGGGVHLMFLWGHLALFFFFLGAGWCCPGSCPDCLHALSMALSWEVPKLRCQGAQQRLLPQ